MAARKTIIGKEPDNELYTPRFVMDWLPPVDLDPSWCPHAVTWPRYYYDIRSNGLDPANPWNADDVQVIFSNPPYQDLLLWIHRMVEAAHHPTRAQVWAFLQAKPGETPWKHYIWPYAHAVGFLPGRIKHGRPPGAGKEVSGTFNSALVLWDVNPDRAERSIRQVLELSSGHKHAPVFVRPVDGAKAYRKPPTPEEIKKSRRS